MGSKNSHNSKILNNKISNKRFANFDNYIGNPNEITLLNDINNEPYTKYTRNNSFCAFKSLYDIFYIIYSSKIKSIIFYDLIDNKKIIEIKNAHKKDITAYRHYADIYNERDLIISISLDDNNIKLWNVNNFECLLNIENVNEDGSLLSSCFLNDKNQIYIVTSNQDAYYVEPIKIFNLKGKIIKKINKSNNSVNFIDIYYDTKNSKIYILVCNDDNVKSYDYKNNKIYKIYGENYRERYSIYIPNDDIYPDYLIMNNKEELIQLNTDGKIRIWNFHSAMLLKIINLDIECQLKSFCLWNNEYLFVAKEINMFSRIKR